MSIIFKIFKTNSIKIFKLKMKKKMSQVQLVTYNKDEKKCKLWEKRYVTSWTWDVGVCLKLDLRHNGQHSKSRVVLKEKKNQVG